MNKFSNTDTKWKNEAEKLERSIRAGEDISEEIINNFMEFTKKLFSGTPYLQPAEDRAFELRRQWKSLQLRKKREKRQEEEISKLQNNGDQIMENTVELDKASQDLIRDSINKIAIENNIKMADGVKIKLSFSEGIIKFVGSGLGGTNESK